jgi:hypothetical protein
LLRLFEASAMACLLTLMSIVCGSSSVSEVRLELSPVVPVVNEWEPE